MRTRPGIVSSAAASCATGTIQTRAPLSFLRPTATTRPSASFFPSRRSLPAIRSTATPLAERACGCWKRRSNSASCGWSAESVLRLEGAEGRAWEVAIRTGSTTRAGAPGLGRASASSA